MKAAQIIVRVLVAAAALVYAGAQKPKYDPDADVYLIKGGMVYGPEAMGMKDILVTYGKIQAILEPGEVDHIKLDGAPIRYEIIDATNLAVGPGWMDCHTHPLGGGGEGGPRSRAPEARLSHITTAGITTIVAMLGTDGITRSLLSLLAKVRAFNEDGITAFFMSGGGYRVPIQTVASNLQEDMIIIPECLGIGELAMADQRGNGVDDETLEKLGGDVYTGGLLAGKSGGIVHIHTGSGPEGITALFELMEKTSTNIRAFHPTHLTDRGEELIAEAKKWLQAGGNGDITGDLIPSFTDGSRVLNDWLQGGDVPMDRLTLSSDAFGSAPVFDDQGNLVTYDIGQPTLIFDTLKTLLKTYKWKIEELLPLVTSNVARVYNLATKGSIAEGYDADFTMFNPNNLGIKIVMAKGKLMVAPNYVRKDGYE